MNILLWVVYPYVCLAVLIGGTIWRYRYDKFGWTTRSSQVYESRLLRLGSPLFHGGILVVAVGHGIGLLIPASWTAALGMSEAGYHAMSFTLGTVAGTAAVAGLAILIYRRRTVGPVFSATTANDKVMYLLLAATMLLGLGTTVIGALIGAHVNYRESVSPWFRSLFILQPRPELMAHAAPGFQLHAIAAWLLFAFWPFTRLVHVFSAPIGYLTRPYIVYRSRDTGRPVRTPRAGWAPLDAAGAPPAHRHRRGSRAGVRGDR